eukprot:tig00020675_g12636.t1
MIFRDVKAKQDFLVGDGEDAVLMREQLTAWMGFKSCDFTKLFKAGYGEAVQQAAQKFFKSSSGKAPIVVIMSLETGHVIGGFTTRTFDPSYSQHQGERGSKQDSLAFIFRLCREKGRFEPCVFHIKSGADDAIYSNDSSAGYVYTADHDNCDIDYDYDDRDDRSHGHVHVQSPSFGSQNGTDLAFLPASGDWRLPQVGSSTYESAPRGTFPGNGTRITAVEVYQVMLDCSAPEPGNISVFASFRHLCFEECTRNELIEALMRRTPKHGGELSVDYYNVLLFAGVGAGKSSFVNALDSAFLGRISALANVGRGSASVTVPLTKRFLDDTNVCLWDCMGWTADTYTKDEFEYIINGHVPDGFDLRMSINLKTEGLILKPTLADRVHVVVFVVPAESLTSESYLARLRSFIEITRKPSIDVRAVVLITKVDTLDRELAGDVAGIFESPRVLRAVDILAGPQGVGVSPTFILPVKSYAFESEPNAAVDVLTLDALQCAPRIPNAI